jgi:hypothetical protein
MKKTAWTVMFALAALLIASCGQSQPEPSQPAPSDQPRVQPVVPEAGEGKTPAEAESGGQATVGEASPAEQPGEASPAEQPGEASPAQQSGEESGTRVVGAVGKALLKSFSTGGKEEAGKAPPANP